MNLAIIAFTKLFYCKYSFSSLKQSPPPQKKLTHYAFFTNVKGLTWLES